MPSADTLIGLLAEVVMRRPNALALVDAEGKCLTYRELDAEAARVASVLAPHCRERETPIGVCLPRGGQVAVTFYGILKAGGVYLPLDAASPPARIGQMVRGTRTRVALAALETLHLLPSDLVVIDPRELPEAAPSADAPVTGTDLAYIIHTSGSTGIPKGVMVSHANAVSLVEAQRAASLVAPGESVLAFAALAFDASIWELLLALAYAAPLWIAGEVRDGVIGHSDNTVATLVPSVLETLDPERATFAGIIAAGERLSRKVADRWAGHFPMWNAYGPAEATVCASIGKVTAGGAGDPDIGRPLVNTSVTVRLPSGARAPTGSEGEICIGGRGVTRGYLGQPGRTALAFVPDPDGEPGTRLYRTGDYGWLRPDGTIEFGGRRDEQVKINGQRIELGEIEQALLRVGGISAARAIVHRRGNGPQYVLGFVVADAQVDVVAMRSSLARQLPAYMVPVRVVQIEAIPTTLTGKTDRIALARLADAARVTTTTLSQAERRMASLWTSALETDQLSSKDDFFALGGHSLLAAKVVSEVRRTYQRDVAVALLYQCPTLAAFTEAVLEAKHLDEKPA